MTYPRPYKELLRALINYGLHPAHIAAGGGFPRDIIHGRLPNDLDLVVVGGLPENIAGMDFESCLPREWVITEWHREDADYDGASVDFTSRLEQVVQLRYTGADIACYENKFGHVDVDILVATSEYKTVGQHIRDNDFNLNHYMIPSLGFLDDEAPQYIGETPAGVLVQCRTSQVTQMRHATMVEKAKAYGWHANIPYKETHDEPEQNT